MFVCRTVAAFLFLLFTAVSPAPCPVFTESSHFHETKDGRADGLNGVIASSVSLSLCDLILSLIYRYLWDQLQRGPWDEFWWQMTKRAQWILLEAGISRDQARFESCFVWGFSNVGKWEREAFPWSQALIHLAQQKISWFCSWSRNTLHDLNSREKNTVTTHERAELGLQTPRFLPPIPLS